MPRRIEFTIGDNVHTYRYPNDDCPYAVILCHGGGGWGGMYDDFSYPFQDRTGADIWSLDCPGFGLSGRGRGEFTIGEFEAALDAVIAEIRTHHAKPIFTLGNSMGGILSSIGFYKDEIRGVCVSASPLTVTSPFYQMAGQALNNPGTEALFALRWSDYMYISLWELMDLEKNYGDPERAKAMGENPLHSDMIKLKSWASLFSYQPPYPLTENKKPFLFISADRDPMFPPETRDALLASVGGPQEVLIIDSDKHAVMLVNTEEYIEKFDSWARELI